MIRMMVVLILSVLLHLIGLTVDFDLFSISGENRQLRSIGYVARSVDSFLPARETQVFAVKGKSLQQQQSRIKSQDRSEPKIHFQQKVTTIIEPAIPKKKIEEPVEIKLKTVEDDSVVPTQEPPGAKSVPEQIGTVEESEAHEMAEVSKTLTELQNDLSHKADSVATTAEMFTFVAGAESVGSLPAEIPVEGKYQSALPRYDINPRPEYPRVAKMRGWEGKVLFDVLVLKNGRIGNLKLLSSSGYRSLDSAARKALRRWKFKPATSFGMPIDSQVRVPIKFSLRTL